MQIPPRNYGNLTKSCGLEEQLARKHPQDHWTESLFRGGDGDDSSDPFEESQRDTSSPMGWTSIVNSDLDAPWLVYNPQDGHVRPDELLHDPDTMTNMERVTFHRRHGLPFGGTTGGYRQFLAGQLHEMPTKDIKKHMATAKEAAKPSAGRGTV